MATITWSVDEESSSEEEAESKEVANIYLISHEEENKVSIFSSYQFTFNELQDAFDDLIVEFKKVEIKNSFLENMISTISKENEGL